MNGEERAGRVARELEQIMLDRSSAIVAMRSLDASVILHVGTDALGRAMDDDTVVPMFCLAKPLVAAAVHQAVHAGELSLDDRVGDLIRVHRSLEQVTILDLLEHRSGITGPNGIEAGLLGPKQRRTLLSEAPLVQNHPTHYSEVLAFEALGWCLEEAVGAEIGAIVARPGVSLGGASAEAIERSQVWVSEIVAPDGGAYPLLFPLSRAAITDPNPGFGGYCRPTVYLDAIASWLSQPDAPRFVQPAYDGALRRKISWSRGICTSLGSELEADAPTLIGHLGFMGSSCIAFDTRTGVSVFAVLSPMVLDVRASRQLLGQIVSAAISSEQWSASSP